ncbi:hypothetical protein BaRGS_00034807 [Batillaria attramentaria]|uniref:JmjC domain-containing protein n=1 Tax=Batillaria attramentaria TaxID=370345 RepID=A0ABD0JG82_9CAEN
MGSRCLSLLSTVLLCLLCVAHTQSPLSMDLGRDEFVNFKGHLKAFGESGKRLDVDVTDKFPPPEEFFSKFVQQSRPLKMSGAARDTRACRLWSDDYLLSLKLPDGQGSDVKVERTKQHNYRIDEENYRINFHDFLRIYNNTEIYVVDSVPEFLRADVMVPCSLQCHELIQSRMANAKMWFSSGGTRSGVHTDTFDNIHCLFRGQKTFVLVDPALHREKVDLNHKGYYSDMDVDSVDLTLYRKLAQVEFYHINMTAGDCLYIPYRWIHQVRSYNSNIAVNFWWNHYSLLDALEKGMSCPDTCDHQLTLQDVALPGPDAFSIDHAGIRDWLVNILISTESLSQRFIVEEISGIAAEAVPETVLTIFSQMFDQLDSNKDGMFTLEEAQQTTQEEWKNIASDIAVVNAMLDEFYRQAIAHGYHDTHQHVTDEL